MFEQTILTTTGGWRRVAAMLASAGGQGLAAGAALLVPLVFPEALPLMRAAAGLIEPPSPPPPRAVKVVGAVRSPGGSRAAARTLVEPRQMPVRTAVMLDDSPLAFAAQCCTADAGVEGGLDVGRAQASPLRWLNQVRALPPPPPKPEPTPLPPPAFQRIRLGGNAQKAKLVHMVKPVYPPLARAARVSGVVRLEAVIGTDGRVHSLRLLSGHPLLAPAAIGAVRQWVYRPTLLNGDPVEVAAPIEVNFLLE